MYNFYPLKEKFENHLIRFQQTTTYLFQLKFSYSMDVSIMFPWIHRRFEFKNSFKSLFCSQTI